MVVDRGRGIIRSRSIVDMTMTTIGIIDGPDGDETTTTMTSTSKRSRRMIVLGITKAGGGMC